MPKKSAPRKNIRIPSLRRCNGRGFVELGGVRHYLGPWGAEETEEAYRREIAQWLGNGCRQNCPPEEMNVVELCERFYEHAQSYYRRPDGTLTTSIDGVREAVRVLSKLYGRVPVSQFGPLALRTVREVWVSRGLSRSTVNAYTQNARAIFRWGVSHELVPSNIDHALVTVKGLSRGRSEARETEPILPVENRHIEAVKPLVSRPVAALIALQLLTGARPGELVNLRPSNIDQTGEIWIVKLELHKTAYRGRQRTLQFGPRAQAIPKPFLLRPADTYCFSPRDAQADLNAKANSHRRLDQKPNRRKTERRLGDAYKVGSYRRAIETACIKAKIPVWTPHRLRHTFATQIRKTHGLEAAQVALGHSHADVTQVYAETNAALAMKVAKEVG